MKTSLLTLLVALSASVLAASPTVPAASAASPFAYSVSAIPQPDNTDITLGTARTTVRRMMGEPQRQLAPNVWAYSGYHPSVAPDQEHGCDTLIITFAGGRVSDLKIVNKDATGVIAANLKFRPASVRIAKK